MARATQAGLLNFEGRVTVGSRVNKYGLSEYIPRPIRLQVRQECGFGCVVCGKAIIEYHHFNPPFPEAKEHCPDRIAALCGACHNMTKAMWSTEKIAAARMNPITFQNGFAREAFDIQPPFSITIGNTSVENAACVVKTREGEEWLTVEPPEADGAPMRLSARFFDENCNPSLTIDENEWKVSLEQWDTEVVGRQITVRRGRGTVALVLCAVPPHGISLQRLQMRKNDVEICVDQDGHVTIARGGGTTKTKGCQFAYVDCVFLV